jgi:hypothetical protein
MTRAIFIPLGDLAPEIEKIDNLSVRAFGILELKKTFAGLIGKKENNK